MDPTARPKGQTLLPQSDRLSLQKSPFGVTIALASTRYTMTQFDLSHVCTLCVRRPLTPSSLRPLVDARVLADTH